MFEDNSGRQDTTPPAGAAPVAVDGNRSAVTAALRGLRRKCPACGIGALYSGVLQVSDTCANCGTEFHHHRADDAPPYIVMFIVGHIVIGLVLWVEKSFGWPTWLHAVVWLPVIAASSIALLPSVKGAIIGIQWAERMHGFSGNEQEASGA